ncbi:MAG: DUF1361 domain-containing protein [Bacteroidetes bacterium]|nr:MAG: DUF1361 domain-containing protein [Bacteroidota bacterium]
MKMTTYFRSRFRDERQYRLFLLLALASGLDILLVLARSVLVQYRGLSYGAAYWNEIAGFLGLGFGFLIWNLFLAWVPYLAAFRFERADRQNSNTFRLLGWFGLWLLFLPNAPYIITDLIHLEYRPPVPIWYDIIMLFAFASTGLWIGTLSLYEIRTTLQRRFSGKLTEMVMLTAIGLSGFGVWLGRFQRWNSWDIFTRPRALLRDLVHTAQQWPELAKALGISALISVLVLAGYVMVAVMLTGKSRRP